MLARSLEIAAPAPLGDPPKDPHFGDRQGVDRWEMVIPRMNRPTARSSKKLVPEQSQARTLAEDFSPPEAQSSATPPAAQISHPGGLLSIAARESPSRHFIEDAVAQEMLGVLRARAAQLAAIATHLSRNPRLLMTIGASAAALLVAGTLLFGLKQDVTVPRASSPIAAETGPALDVDPARWMTLSQSPRQINVVRDSMQLADFRMDFQGLADAKTSGWVFRVKDAENYYAMSVEIAKPTAASSSAVLKRFAVIDGRDEPMAQTLVAIGYQPGAMYKVRTEGRGSTFTTWIADRKVDEWTDARLSNGGVGLYNDRSEAATIVADLVVFPLVRK